MLLVCAAVNLNSLTLTKVDSAPGMMKSQAAHVVFHMGGCQQADAFGILNLLTCEDQPRPLGIASADLIQL